MYNKIFHKILDSSIWLEPTPTRIVWITLLAAMDQDGYAHFSALENLAARARVTIDEAREAVECFLAPDENSANPANEGRRIERIPGGYMILNADIHRQTVNRIIQREQTRERVAKHRAKEKERYTIVTEVLPIVTPRPYTETETETEALKPTLMSGKSPDALLLTEKNKACKADARQVLDFLNDKTGKAYRPVDANLKPIETILKSGVPLQHILTVTMRKVRDWREDPKMQQYLRPSTLYRRSNFEQYLGQTIVEKKPNG